MPVSMTFTNLQTDIQAFLERGTAVDTTFYDNIPMLINVAERNIARELKIETVTEVVTSSFASGTSTYAKPDRWRETVSIHYGSGQSRSPLFPRSYEYCRAYWPDPSVNGTPKFYADYNYSNWLISPTPDAAYNYEVIYRAQPQLLDAVNTTNYLTDFLPELLLYRSLLECALFLKDGERIAQFKSFYDESRQAVKEEDINRIVDRTVTRQES